MLILKQNVKSRSFAEQIVQWGRFNLFSGLLDWTGINSDREPSNKLGAN